VGREEEHNRKKKTSDAQQHCLEDVVTSTHSVVHPPIRVRENKTEKEQKEEGRMKAKRWMKPGKKNSKTCMKDR
jgi:hypothetical protein